MSEDTKKKEVFNKPEQFEYLSKIVVENCFSKLKDGTIVVDYDKYVAMISDKFEPKKGGGATKFPHKVDEAGNILECYCRLKQEYRPLAEMQTSKGEPKGVTSLASKHQYRLAKKADELEKEALGHFTTATPDGIAKGQQLMQEASEIKATLELPATYADEKLQYLVKEEEGDK